MNCRMNVVLPLVVSVNILLGCATSSPPRATVTEGHACGAPGMLEKVIRDNSVTPELGVKIPEVVPVVGGLGVDAKVGISNKLDAKLQQIGDSNQRCYFASAVTMCAVTSTDAAAPADKPAWMDLTKTFNATMERVCTEGKKPKVTQVDAQKLQDASYFGPVYLRVGDRYVGRDWRLVSEPTVWTLRPGTYGKFSGYWVFDSKEVPAAAWAARIGQGGDRRVGRFWNIDRKAAGNPEDHELFVFRKENDASVTLKNIYGEDTYVKFANGEPFANASRDAATQFVVEIAPD